MAAVKKVPSLTLRLELVSFKEVRVFYDPRTGRATSEIMSFDLPFHSRVKLVRDERVINEARCALANMFQFYTEVFDGTFPLVRAERRFEKVLSPPHHYAGARYAESIRARTRGLHLGDAVLIRFEKPTDDSHRGTWTFEQWCENVTFPTRDDAVRMRTIETTKKEVAEYLEKNYDLSAHCFAGQPWIEKLRLAEALVRKGVKNAQRA